MSYKRRLLAAAGWRVVSVPFFEWDNLSDELEKRRYLKGLLHEAGAGELARVLR